jgi:hypothetical protein
LADAEETNQRKRKELLEKEESKKKKTKEDDVVPEDECEELMRVGREQMLTKVVSKMFEK